MGEHQQILPPGKEDVYRQIGFCEAVRAGNLIFAAGQVGWESYETQKFSPDLESQTRQALENLRGVLELAGCGPKDVTQLMFFMVDPSDGKQTLWDELGIVFKIKTEMFPDCMPCGTAVRVKELVIPGLLIEIQAVAVTPTAGGKQA